MLADALDVFALQWDHVAVDDTAPPVAEAHELTVVDLRAFEHRAPDDSVQAGAVAPAGEDSDLHELHHGASGRSCRDG